MKDIMLDLETLGVAAGCKILSIGAVYFDISTGELGEEFYVIVNRADQDEYDLKEEGGTLAWWLRQSAEARVVVQEEPHTDAVDLIESLARFGHFVRQEGGGKRVWGNGADFDNPILSRVYEATGQRQPWAAYNGRCYRTIKNLYPSLKAVREGTYHNALDDAKTQAKHMIQVCRALGIKEVA